MTKAMEILEELIASLTLRSYPKRPGVVIEKLSEEKRKVLSKLTSKETQNLRGLI